MTVPVRALLWTARALHSTRRQVRRHLAVVVVPAPRRPVAVHTRWVRAVVRRTPTTCLVQALVLQRWQLGLGDPRDVVVGVTPPSRGFRAHAWLDGTPAGGDFQELRRIPPPSRP